MRAPQKCAHRLSAKATVKSFDGRTKGRCLVKHDRPTDTASPSLPRTERERDQKIPESVIETRDPCQGLSQSLDEFILDRFSTNLEDPRTGRKIDCREP